MDTLRPDNFDAYIGQQAIKDRLLTHVRAAKSGNHPLEHIFIPGPAGSGKTTLASLVSEIMDLPFEALTMPVSNANMLRTLRKHYGEQYILLLDELHSGSKRQQEDVMPLLEHGFFRTNSGSKLNIEGVTVIGATTERAKVLPALRQKFGIQLEMGSYSDTEMGQIVAGMAKKANLEMPTDMAEALGRATGGIPRNARQFVLAARDIHLTAGHMPNAAEVLAFCDVSSDGLTASHRAYMRAISDVSGGVAGLNTLKSVLDRDESSVREIERLLVQKGFLTYSERGRELTSDGFKRLAEVEAA